MRLYWTDLVTSPSKLIVDPVRVEFFKGPRIYKVFMRVSPPVVRTEVATTIAAQQEIHIPGDRYYVELIARKEEAFGGRQYCEDHIDRIVTQLSACLSPGLFAQEIWSGWLSDSGKLFSNMWLMRQPEVIFVPNKVQKEMLDFQKAVAGDPDKNARFTLMSKLFTRGVATEPGEERFLWLWTVLEVFPMKDTSNIKPISEYLASVTGLTDNEIKTGLEIRKLFGARSSLVHDGHLPYAVEELGPVLERLEAIDVTVLRSLGGLPYSGNLNKFLV